MYAVVSIKYPVHPYNQEASSLQNKIENTAEFVEPTRDADEAITIIIQTCSLFSFMQWFQLKNYYWWW